MANEGQDLVEDKKEAADEGQVARAPQKKIPISNLKHLRGAHEAKMPEERATYSKQELLTERRKIVRKFRREPGLFKPNKIAARKIFLARYAEQTEKATKRMEARAIKFEYYTSLVPQDMAVNEIDIELEVIFCSPQFSLDLASPHSVGGAETKKTKKR